MKMKGEIKPLYGIIVMIVFTVILAGAIYIYVEKGQKESKQENTYTIGSILHVVVNDRDIVCLKGFDTDNTRGYIIGKLVGFSEEVEINFNEGVAYAYGDENLTEEVLSINYFDPENNIFVYAEKGIQIQKRRYDNNTYQIELETYVPIENVVIVGDGASIHIQGEKLEVASIGFLEVASRVVFLVTVETDNATIYIRGHVKHPDMIFTRNINLTQQSDQIDTQFVKIIQYGEYWFKIYSMPDGRIIIRVFDSNWNEVARDVIRVEG